MKNIMMVIGGLVGVTVFTWAFVVFMWMLITHIFGMDYSLYQATGVWMCLWTIKIVMQSNVEFRFERGM